MHEEISADEKISTDAQEAWDEGKHFYAASFTAFTGRGVVMLFSSADEHLRFAKRYVE
jgi:hypothetical protein